METQKIEGAVQNIEAPKVAGQRVDRAMVDQVVLSRTLRLLELRQSGTVEELVTRLELFMADCFARRWVKSGEEHPQSVPMELIRFFVTCDCGGDFDDRLLCCPFCGDEGPSPNITNAQRKVKPYRQADAVSELRARYGVVREAFGVSMPEPAVEEKPEAAVEQKPAAAPASAEKKLNGKGKPQLALVPAAPPSEPKGAPVAAEPQKLVHVKGKGKPQNPLPFASPVVDTTAIEIPSGTEEELDAKKAEAVAIYGDVMAGAARVAVDVGRLGRVLGEIEDRKLYLQRRDEKGVPKYKSMSQWMNVELDFGATYGFDLMVFARKFTAEEIAALGPARLKYLARTIGTEAGKALAKEAAEKQLSVGEVRDRVNELAPPEPRAGKSAPPSGTGFSGTRDDDDDAQGEEQGSAPAPSSAAPKPGRPVPKPSTAPKQAAKPEPERITCALLPGRQTLPLLARTMKKGALPKAAKKLGDDPWCEVVHPNGVVQTFRVIVVKGELRLTIDTVRGD